MNHFLKILSLLLILAIGLHLPRSYALMYLFSGIVYLLGSVVTPAPIFRGWSWILALEGRSTLLLMLFSAAYVMGMLGWGFWVWPQDFLDAINALILPALLFLVGTRAGSLSRSWSSSALMAYGIGGLIYVLAALAVSRVPWWNMTEVFPSAIQVAWGNNVEVNVRSVEQSAYPALAVLPSAFLLIFDCAPLVRKWLGGVLLLLAALAAHAVWSLNGRLGWFALLIASLPVLGLLYSPVSVRFSRIQLKLLIAVISIVIGLATSWFIQSFQGMKVGSIWSQGFCDERLSLFASTLARLREAPWGGRLLRVPYTLCTENSPTVYMAAQEGAISMAHNVILDIYFNVGWAPVFFLLMAILPVTFVIARNFLRLWPAWDWRIALRWGWAALLACQWFFQPLLYSDGLLYYFSFFVLGLLCSEALNVSSPGLGAGRESVKMPLRA